MRTSFSFLCFIAALSFLVLAGPSNGQARLGEAALGANGEPPVADTMEQSDVVDEGIESGSRSSASPVIAASIPWTDADRTRAIIARPSMWIGQGGTFQGIGVAEVVDASSGDPQLVLQSNVPGDFFGFRAAAAGDIDQDGVGDFIVGAPTCDLAGQDAGSVYVFSGDDGELIWAFSGGPGAMLGRDVIAAGDFDGDGVADVAVSAFVPQSGVDLLSGGPRIGEVWVFSGSTFGPLARFTGTAAGDGFGRSITPAGDQDGDGVPELAVLAAPAVDALNATVSFYSLTSAPPASVSTGSSAVMRSTSPAWSVTVDLSNASLPNTRLFPRSEVRPLNGDDPFTRVGVPSARVGSIPNCMELNTQGNSVSGHAAAITADQGVEVTLNVNTVGYSGCDCSGGFGVGIHYPEPTGGGPPNDESASDDRETTGRLPTGDRSDDAAATTGGADGTGAGAALRHDYNGDGRVDRHDGILLADELAKASYEDFLTASDAAAYILDFTKSLGAPINWDGDLGVLHSRAMSDNLVEPLEPLAVHEGLSATLEALDQASNDAGIGALSTSSGNDCCEPTIPGLPTACALGGAGLCSVSCHLQCYHGEPCLCPRFSPGHEKGDPQRCEDADGDGIPNYSDCDSDLYDESPCGCEPGTPGFDMSGKEPCDCPKSSVGRHAAEPITCDNNDNGIPDHIDCESDEYEGYPCDCEYGQPGNHARPPCDCEPGTPGASGVEDPCSRCPSGSRLRRGLPLDACLVDQQTNTSRRTDDDNNNGVPNYLDCESTYFEGDPCGCSLGQVGRSGRSLCDCGQGGEECLEYLNPATDIPPFFDDPSDDPSGSCPNIYANLGYGYHGYYGECGWLDDQRDLVDSTGDGALDIDLDLLPRGAVFYPPLIGSDGEYVVGQSDLERPMNAYGFTIPVNVNDSDGNGLSDLFDADQQTQRAARLADKQLRLDPELRVIGLQVFAGRGAAADSFDASLDYDPEQVRVWADPYRTRLIAPGESLLAVDSEFFNAGGGRTSLKTVIWVEMLGLHAADISLTATNTSNGGGVDTDTIRVYGIGVGYVPINGQGNPIDPNADPLLAAPFSNPTPNIDVQSHTLGNLRLSDDKRSLIADLDFAAEIVDSAAGLFDRDGPTALALDLEVNGEQAEVITTGFNSLYPSALVEETSRPAPEEFYKYEVRANASSAGRFHAVRLLPGVNTFEFLARGAGNRGGYAQFTANADIRRRDVSVLIEPATDSLGGPDHLSDVLKVVLTIDGVEQIHQFDRDPDLPLEAVYTSPLPSGGLARLVIDLPVNPGQSALLDQLPDDFARQITTLLESPPGTIELDQLVTDRPVARIEGLITVTNPEFELEETGEATGRFTGELRHQDDYSAHVIEGLSGMSQVFASEAGSLTPFAMVFGPKEFSSLADATSSRRYGQGLEVDGFVELDDWMAFAVETPGGDLRHGASILTVSDTSNRGVPHFVLEDVDLLSLLDDPRTDRQMFADGFGSGFWQAGCDYVGDFVTIGRSSVYIYKQTVSGVSLYFATLALIAEGDFETIHDQFDQAAERFADGLAQVGEVLQAASTTYGELYVDRDALIALMFKVDGAEALLQTRAGRVVGAAWTTIDSMIGDLLHELETNPELQGKVLGYITGTLLVEIAEIALTAGAAKAVKLAKIEKLRQAAIKLSNTRIYSKPGDPAAAKVDQIFRVLYESADCLLSVARTAAVVATVTAPAPTDSAGPSFSLDEQIWLLDAVAEHVASGELGAAEEAAVLDALAAVAAGSGTSSDIDLIVSLITANPCDAVNISRTTGNATRAIDSLADEARSQYVRLRRQGMTWQEALETTHGTLRNRHAQELATRGSWDPTHAANGVHELAAYERTLVDTAMNDAFDVAREKGLGITRDEVLSLPTFGDLKRLSPGLRDAIAKADMERHHWAPRYIIRRLLEHKNETRVPPLTPEQLKAEVTRLADLAPASPLHYLEHARRLKNAEGNVADPRPIHSLMRDRNIGDLPYGTPLNPGRVQAGMLEAHQRYGDPKMGEMVVRWLEEMDLMDN